jgi:hypothetical protein
MLVVFWDYQGVLLAHFQKHGGNVIYFSFYEVLLILRDAIRRKLPGQLAEGDLHHHDNARPHTEADSSTISRFSGNCSTWCCLKFYL